MNIRDLIEQLEELAEAHGDHTEVRLAQQPNWPFENAVDEVVAVDLNGPDEDDPEAASDEPEVVVYIGEGAQLGYLPGAASRALGWR